LERIGFAKNALDQFVVNLIKDGYHCTLCQQITCVDFVIDYLEDVFKTITVQYGNTHSYLGMDIVFTDDKAVLSTVTTV
jgi:hypothetical protein